MLGGLAAGFRHKDYILDFGPHRLHTELAPDVLRDLQLLLGQDLVQRTRHGKIRVAGRYVPYPLGPRAVLSLGIPRLAALTAGIALAKAQGNSSPAGSYEAMLVRRLGRPSTISSTALTRRKPGAFRAVRSQWLRRSGG